MGKARILQALGEGRYTIEIIEARERAEVAKQQALARITQLQTQVNALTQQINAAQSAFATAVNEQNAAIAQYQQEMAEEGRSSINLAETAEKVMTTAGERDKLRVEQRSLEVRIKADEALIARINSLPPLRQMQAWCADYTDDLSGEVATAEVPGEIGSVIIKPGFEGANQWSATADGAMQPALASTPAATFYNLAMLPGWQKWRPTYRTATITSIDGDTCSITLDAATSSQQALSVNARSSYSGVPILYMDCNGAAFEQGDKVLVAFAGNINGPTVVGFESAPKMCSALDYITISDEVWDKPSAEYLTNTYYQEEWTTPSLLGMPINGGSYQITESVNKDNAALTVTVSHADSWSATYVVTEDLGSEFFYDSTEVITCQHSCSVVGTVRHLGRQIDVRYEATVNSDFTANYTGFSGGFVGWPGYPERPYSDGAEGAEVASVIWGQTDTPFASVSEMFTIAGVSIDVSRISEHLYTNSSYQYYAEWIRYHPAMSLAASGGFSGSWLSQVGVTKPFNILLPDIVSFAEDGERGLLLVFSSTGPTVEQGMSDYLQQYGPERVSWWGQVRTFILEGTRRYDPDGSDSFYLRNRLDDRKLHVCITLVEREGVFVRAETPSKVLDYFKEQKIRGGSSDLYYDLPLSVAV
ncbi:hypothetical protein ACIGG6_02355 [Vreelandella lionensis]|uniref:Uncharacterized protein n=1 Tax=Vreelandella lionensis TaxID=1144478 RepID=A0ABW8BNP8_9GAMM